MKNLWRALLLAWLAGLFAIFGVRAQSPGLTISFSRDFGYASGGGDIQGVFSIKASGPATLRTVVFYVDDRTIGTVSQAPFNLQFNTSDFPLGPHQIYAVGTTAEGGELKSAVVTANFVSAQEGLQAGMRIALPILVVVFGVILASFVVPLVTGRHSLNLPPGTRRSYPLGGAICPKCGRPFALHLYGLNLAGSKYDRCPYCGRWSFVPHASLEKLRAAEELELAAASTDASGQVPGLSEAEKLERELDESRFREI